MTLELSGRQIIFIVVGGVALLLTAWFASRCDARSEWEDQKEDFQREVEVAEEAVEAWKQRAEEADSVAKATEDSAEATIERAEQRLQASTRRIRRLNTTLERLESDSTVQALLRKHPKLDSIFTAKNEKAVELRNIIADQDSMISVLRVSRDSWKDAATEEDSLNAQLRTQLEIEQRQKEHWMNEAKPSLFEFSLGSLPKDIALVALGRLSAEVF